MNELDAAGQQRYGAVGIGAAVAVLEVAADGAAYRGELHADLMLAACEELDLEEVETVAACEQSVFESWGVL